MTPRKLLACPFCGTEEGDAQIVRSFTRISDDFKFWAVECLPCGVQIADDESQDASDRHWNTRAPHPARAEQER
jgi:Lar family restriction alleviation protein